MRRTSLAALARGVVAALPAAPASACTGTGCDAINKVCSLGGGGGCLPE